MPKDTGRVGMAAHLAVAQRLVERGFEVLEPFRDDLRYDLAYYYPGKEGSIFKRGENPELVRIQCKNGRLTPDGAAIRFNAFNISGGRGKKKSYIGDAEYFGVYCPELRRVFLIPVEICNGSETTIRLKSAGLQRGNRFGSKHVEWSPEYQDLYIWAEDYEI